MLPAGLLRRSPRLRTIAGFSLAEILIVIAIMAIIAAISMPFYRTVSLSLSLNAAGRDLASDLRYAQQLAVTTQTNHQVSFDKIGNSYTVANSATGEILKARKIKAPIIIQSTNLSGNTVIFNATGAANSTGSIILANPNNNLITITIKPSGYVKIN